MGKRKSMNRARRIDGLMRTTCNLLANRKNMWFYQRSRLQCMNHLPDTQTEKICSGSFRWW